MSKINHYKILPANDVAELETEVEKYLQDGWEPLGGPFSTILVREESRDLPRKETKTFWQAVVRA